MNVENIQIHEHYELHWKTVIWWSTKPISNTAAKIKLSLFKTQRSETFGIVAATTWFIQQIWLVETDHSFLLTLSYISTLIICNKFMLFQITVPLYSYMKFGSKWITHLLPGQMDEDKMVYSIDTIDEWINMSLIRLTYSKSRTYFPKSRKTGDSVRE